MRSEKEMFELILNFATSHEDIRAVIMNGSRVNPNVKKDPFQDYDIVYLVRNVEPYKRNMEIVSYFGEIVVLQLPDDMDDPTPLDQSSYAYLMQFMDGNRIDLTFYPLEDIKKCVEDTLTVVLLDKDHLIGELPPPSDLGYLPEKPTEKMYHDCCNEFWWMNPYVAKGLWRGELTYAKYMMEILGEKLMNMLTWYFGIKTGFHKAPGKCGKYIQYDLESRLWDQLEMTYADSQPENNWQSLFVMGDLFRELAESVATTFGFTYPEQYDQNVSNFIRRIKTLPSGSDVI